MDRNTITGIILMALVFFGFMWLSPKQNDKKDTQTENSAAVQAPEQAPVAADTLSAQELTWLRQNMASAGSAVKLEDGRNAVKIQENGVNLTIVGDSIFGTVEVADGKTVTWKQLASADPYAMTLKEQNAGVQKVREISQRLGKYGRFAQFLEGKQEIVTMENDVLSLQLNSKSGTITRAELKKYDSEYNADETKREKHKVVIFEDGSNSFCFNLPTLQPLETSELYFTPTVVNDTTVRMILEPAPGAYWGFEYTLPKGESYLVTAKVIQKNMTQVLESNNHYLGLNWRQEMRRQEQGRMFEERQSGLYYKFAGGSVEHLSDNKNDREDRQQKLSWIAFKNQFFSTIVVPSRPFATADFSSNVLKGNDYLKNLQADAAVNDYDWSSANPVTFTYFIGPNSYPLLSRLQDEIIPDEDLSFTRLIPLGWSIFRWINTGIVIPVFNFLGKFISNYGIIILLLTLLIKLILFPLTYKSYVSQAKMKFLQPDIKALREKYPGKENALILNQKTMELYRKAGANPMSGCLPMLLQIPILFAVFQFFPSCIQLRGESFLWAHDLAAPDAIISWSGNIPLITNYFGNHISLFCLLMTATNIVYTYINMQNSPQTMPGMKWMMYLMPVFFLVFFNNYAAGLSYYYFLSLLITIIQTYVIRHFIIKEEDVRKAMAENAKKPRKKSGFMARLEEMQRKQQQMLREQQQQQRRGR
ncbi:MAG: membrane protein insertase YidC [Muribaculaceae bacterium]|nr:membrane protein insertase YidC [Muribaculaceae bacterium]